METLTYRFDADSLMNTMAAAFVHRLRDYGVSAGDAHRHADKAAGAMASRMMETMQRTTESVGLLLSHGVESREAIDSNASAVFAIAGVKIADEVFKSLVAERN